MLIASAGIEMLCKTVLPKTEIGEIGFDKIEKNKVVVNYGTFTTTVKQDYLEKL